MFVDKTGAHTAPTLSLKRKTLVFDQRVNKQVAWLDGVVVPPIGSKIELAEPNVTGFVTGIRLMLGQPGGDTHSEIPSNVCIDVEIPEEWWKHNS
ncbi:hypothetical protein [Myxococcus virescens]|uniref:Uncharacterized protein n=1 Tax=Myxococcus virescens TaxID=83456 RepID=A0A511HMP3_9BACT|nr:hypothetical protein [Myxococcus virescens]GEL74635.1 hypothetical protein MVI01_64190 [Myxococcus virescens]SDE54785.1 hypothetical protein SAMN04488504_108164 [Myxococcus virescens]